MKESQKAVSHFEGSTMLSSTRVENSTSLSSKRMGIEDCSARAAAKSPVSAWAAIFTERERNGEVGSTTEASRTIMSAVSANKHKLLAACVSRNSGRSAHQSVKDLDAHCLSISC